MAKQVLPTNFQDDVLSASMNGKRRYFLTPQDDGSYILNDATEYDSVGSTFGAAQINQTNQAVNQSVDKDDVLSTMEEIDANTDAGKVAGALAVKELSSELSANGNKFYFDYQNGEYGYNTAADRGADTFHPFNDITSGTVDFIMGQVAQVYTGKRPRYLSAFQSNSYPIWIIYDVDHDPDNALYYRSYSNLRGKTPIDGSGGIVTISDDGFSIGPMSNIADEGAFTYFCI